MTDNTLWASPPEPQTGLGRYRVLANRAGIRVSPIQLGAMSIGDKWAQHGMGSMDKESSFKLLDAYYDAGGNFIDTANIYQDGTSEGFIGEWAEKRGIRNQLVIATKYSCIFRRDTEDKIKVNYVGNNIKSMNLSVEESLKNLRTSYIDILYVHWWDWDTAVEEVMDGLHQLVLSGKVYYLGVSDTPAWIVAEANRYATENGKTPFVIYQGAWNVMERSFEREIIPMARKYGMALAPWDVLAAGKLRTDEEEAKREQSGEKGRTLWLSENWKRNEDQRKMSAALEKVAKEVGAKHIQSVAIAYLMQKTTHVFPIVGGRKVEHLMANLEALEISLSDEHIKYIESILPWNPGFPTWFIGDGSYNIGNLTVGGHMEKWPLRQPIKPARK